jgi:site-specific DNA-cytosine methylase
LSYETTQDKTKLQSSELQSSTQWSWLLRKALSEIQKIRKSSSNQSERSFRIRKLTPLEAFRLQGFDDSFVKPVSNSQLYKQAGNTISVNVIQAILKNLLKTFA